MVRFQKVRETGRENSYPQMGRSRASLCAGVDDLARGTGLEGQRPDPWLRTPASLALLLCSEAGGEERDVPNGLKYRVCLFNHF